MPDFAYGRELLERLCPQHLDRAHQDAHVAPALAEVGLDLTPFDVARGGELVIGVLFQLGAALVRDVVHSLAGGVVADARDDPQRDQAATQNEVTSLVLRATIWFPLILRSAPAR